MDVQDDYKWVFESIWIQVSITDNLSVNQIVDREIHQRALMLESQGIKAIDALHAAAAEAANADYFVTCDDRFLRRYKRVALHPLIVCDPTEFVRLVADNKQGE